MGIAFWLVSGVAAFFVARIVPYARRKGWLAELFAAAAAAALLGVVATAMDFGGWNEPDWRAMLFVFFGAFAATGVVRLVSAAG
ncbi:MAG: hypothetical protein M3Q69_20270 [Acidobacteriota bacterium]|nr:hypothetical protein [Acidobacteriota bacterium]